MNRVFIFFFLLLNMNLSYAQGIRIVKNDSSSIVIPADQLYRIESYDSLDNTNVTKGRIINYDPSTFSGAVNLTYDMVQTKWPMAKVFVCTIMKHGRIKSDPDASFLMPTVSGCFIDQYNERIKECAAIAGFPVIDLYSEVGFNPLNQAQAAVFHHNDADMLHPIDAGHKRIAEVVYNHIVNTNGTEGYKGKKAIYFGDSITDNIAGHATKVWWSFLTDWLELRNDGIAPNGYSTKNTIDYPKNAAFYGTGYVMEWEGQPCMYKSLDRFNDDYDLVVIFLGVNDGGIPLGEIYK